jgi:hypothetical protein
MGVFDDEKRKSIMLMMKLTTMMWKPMALSSLSKGFATFETMTLSKGILLYQPISILEGE